MCSTPPSKEYLILFHGQLIYTIPVTLPVAETSQSSITLILSGIPGQTMYIGQRPGNSG